MEDVIMQWLGGIDNKRASVHGVDNIEIPQFSVANYEISSTIEELQTGAWLYILWLRTQRQKL